MALTRTTIEATWACSPDRDGRLETELRTLLGAGVRCVSAPVTGLRRIEVEPRALRRVYRWARAVRVPVTTPLIERGRWRTILHDTNGERIEVLARLR